MTQSKPKTYRFKKGADYKSGGKTIRREAGDKATVPEKIAKVLGTEVLEEV